MLFNSFSFIIFFPIVVGIYFVIPRKIRYIWLLITSYYFYMSWNAKYALLIAGCTLITWISGLVLERFPGSDIRNIVIRKSVVAVSFVTTLGILFFFKYFQFLWDNMRWAVSHLGIQLIDKPFDIILPVGISFYTFQALSYTVDVYRGKVEAEHNPLRYALFVSFFPQLVAGPIERSDNLLPQLRSVEKFDLWNAKRICNGLVYMLYGYFLKMVLADNLSVLADEVFLNYRGYHSVELFIGAIAFTLQIYCDFASYSTIAIGAAEVMGFHLMENFHAPYFASSIQDFWRRWHISLSTWFRDYLYIPLGGSRCSKLKQYRNLMITFLVSGLWHGANWTYVIWGGIHGLYQIIGKELRPLKDRLYPLIGIRLDSISYRIGQAVCTSFLAMLAWIVFRADSLGDAVIYISRMFTKWDLWVLTDGTLDTLGFANVREWFVLFTAILIMLLADIILNSKKLRIDAFLEEQGDFYRMIAVIMFIAMIAVFGRYGGGYDAKAFIYFQF